MAPRSPRPLPRLRALVTDVDGTLTDEHRRLDPDAMLALRIVERQGIPVILATGNVLPVALALHRSLGLSGPIVAENGGLIYERTARGEAVEKLCDRRPALAGFRRLRAAGVPVRRLFTDRWRETEVALEADVPIARVRSHLKGLGLTAEATGYAIHLMERGGGKLPALRRALALRGLALSECLVAGDGDNDVEMLMAAGFAVTFANGSRRAQAAADWVAPSGFAVGFVEALKRCRVLA
jgi:phosphoglycolate phosphatase (TIGR01487 family)